MLDEAYDEIMEKHDDYTIPEYAPPRGRITKKQQVQYQLEKLKKAKVYELIQTYEVAFLMLMILAFGYVLSEEVGQIGNPRVSLSQYFTFSKFLAHKKKQLVIKLKETFAIPTEAQKQGALKRFLDERKMVKQSLGQQKSQE